MKNNFLFFVFFIFLFFLFIVFGQNNSVESFGGQILNVNLTFLNPSSQWQLIYGNSSLMANNSYFVLSNDSFFQEILLPSQSSYYLVTDQEFIPSGDYSIPTTEECDNYFSLSGSSSCSYIFDSVSNFSIFVNNTAKNFSLPTLFLNGYYENGSIYPNAFRAGIIKKSDKILFVVPILRALAFDNKTYDFMFAVPKTISHNQYYVFGIHEPTPTPSDSVGVSGSQKLEQLSLSWEYDGKILKIFSEPQVTILIRDELGQSFSAITSFDGTALLNLKPGLKYYLTAQKTGYRQIDVILYIPAPIILENNTNQSNEVILPKEEKTQEEQLFEPPSFVSIINPSFGSGGTSLICFGEECYQANDDVVLKQSLNDLKCFGDFCTLIGLTKKDFVEKYQLKKVQKQIYIPEKENQIINFSSLFSNVGFKLSESLGALSPYPQRGFNFFMYSFVFFSVLALLIYFLLSKVSKKIPSLGHD
jgi:hypothetical protein